jgi:hypothetical protein
LTAGAKGLLQQYLPTADFMHCNKKTIMGAGAVWQSGKYGWLLVFCALVIVEESFANGTPQPRIDFHHRDSG